MTCFVGKRFTQTDPMPHGAGHTFESAYVYGGARPTVMTDPNGMRFGRGGYVSAENQVAMKNGGNGGSCSPSAGDKLKPKNQQCAQWAGSASKAPPKKATPKKKRWELVFTLQQSGATYASAYHAQFTVPAGVARQVIFTTLGVPMRVDIGVNRPALYPAIPTYDATSVGDLTLFSMYPTDSAQVWMMHPQSDGGLSGDIDVRNFVDGPDGVPGNPNQGPLTGPPNYLVEAADYSVQLKEVTS
jgi:hypothetical protein